MKLAVFAGPPSSGKTSVILKALEHLRGRLKTGVVKFDAVSTTDHLRYAGKGYPVRVGLAGPLCPDHFFASNIERCFAWGLAQGFDLLIAESAGLCNRCAPHLEGALGVGVIDNLAGAQAPAKTGPLLRLADTVVIAKGDIVSQAEREIFAYQVRLANPRAGVLFVNGLTGQGSLELARTLEAAPDLERLSGARLRVSMPAALCSYCAGEVLVGEAFCVGNAKPMALADEG